MRPFVLPAHLVLLACLCLPAACAPRAPTSLSLYAGLPLNGPQAGRAEVLVEGVSLALEQAGQATCGGRYPIRFVPVDHATEGAWDATVEAAVANKAATDPAAVAYIGSWEPGPLLVSLPILNQHGPLLVLGPMNGYPPFTYPRRYADEPTEYYPTGRPNFTRVGPNDFDTGAAAARWAAAAGARRAYVLYDQYDPWQQALHTARGFENSAPDAGVQVVGSLGVDRLAGEYASVMDTIARDSGARWPSLIFYAGPPASHLARLFEAKAAWLGGPEAVPVLAAPGFDPGAFAAAAGAAAEGQILFSPALPPEQWPVAGQAFAEAYQARYGAPPAIEALYGYAAGKAILDAAEAVCAEGLHPANRRRILNAVVAAQARLAADSEQPHALAEAGLLPRGEFGVYRVTGGTLDLLERARAGE
jgi:branched-chain amino acid transport system substrate-binding protein